MIKLSKKKLIIVLIISFLIVVLQIPQYFLLTLKPASAANNYIENIEFYNDADNYLRLKFKVKTSFDINYSLSNNRCWGVTVLQNSGVIENGSYGDNGYWSPIPAEFVDTENRTWQCPNKTYHYIAPNTYTVYLGFGDGPSPANFCHIARLGYLSWGSEGQCNTQTNIPDKTSIFNRTLWGDNEKYNFEVSPILALTWPTEDNIEISVPNFNITGTITQPSPYEYNELWTYVYFYNPWQTDINYGYTDVGIFRTPLQATSTQSFTQEIVGLPASETGTFILINELEKVVNGISVKQYRESGGTNYPWKIEITHLEGGGTSGLPEYLPDWQTYLDIYKPKASDDGYFRIKTPTSSVDFIYKFPKTYKIKITQEGVEKLATSTFDEIDPYGTGFFTVNNIDAATGTVKWLQATVYNYEDEEVINALFPIVGLEEGELENLGYGANENFFTRFLSSLFVPSTTYLNKFKIDLPELLKTKIPFSYFYDIKTAINDIQVGEAKEFPGISYTIAGYNFEFNPLDIEEAGMLESGGWATFYDLMKITCWLMFILYLFGRIRDKTTNTAD